MVLCGPSELYFLVQDTKGNAKASVRYIYQIADTLKKNGFKLVIDHINDNPSDNRLENLQIVTHRFNVYSFTSSQIGPPSENYQFNF